MGQALQDRAPSFCICVYGSDNKFSAEDVLNRWQYLKKQASLHDIEIVGFSSDGNTRCLKAMKEASNFPVYVDTINNDCPYKPYFQIALSPEKCIFIQDTVHIRTTLKTRFFKSNVYLPMGKFTVSARHIEQLIETISKDQNMLCRRMDKMNFEAIDKLSSRNVIELLKRIPEKTKNFYNKYVHLRSFNSSYIMINIKDTNIINFGLLWNAAYQFSQIGIKLMRPTTRI
ncbi:hypothetical protein RN001_003253 [Aquatica leii]|uniref:Uncharacterized protein n=1 Tax=Aquatica leii TaxID=1421715 RepID=A0AAN7SKM8_9COLE|nr:hypothetical protein RN001_003253 [Aquatica leii]